MKVGADLSEELEVNDGVHQGTVLSPLLFVIVMDVDRNRIKEGIVVEILYADDIVLIAEIMAELHEKFYGWKSAHESKGQKVKLMKTKVMVSLIWQVTVRPSSEKDLCGICHKNNGKCRIMEILWRLDTWNMCKYKYGN